MRPVLSEGVIAARLIRPRVAHSLPATNRSATIDLTAAARRQSPNTCFMKSFMGVDVAISDDTFILAADIVSAFVSNNSVPATEVPSLFSDVHAALARLSSVVDQPEQSEVLKPAVSPRKSVTDEYLICLEDGRRFKSLKRHLRTHFGLTPEQYREKWGLDPEYPMVAPAYARARSTFAREMGLGQQRRKR